MPWEQVREAPLLNVQINNTNILSRDPVEENDRLDILRLEIENMRYEALVLYYIDDFANMITMQL